MSQQMIVSSGDDVVGFLKNQHKRVKALFGMVLSNKGRARAEAFVELRRLMAVHETAEEEIVHPAAERALPRGAVIVAARLKEENAAKTALTEIEMLDLDSSEFETKMRELESAVVAHAESEEREEFNKLATALDEVRLGRMRKAVEVAESVAPTRPHPGMESAAANLLAGPFVAMVDRVRDALRGSR